MGWGLVGVGLSFTLRNRLGDLIGRTDKKMSLLVVCWALLLSSSAAFVVAPSRPPAQQLRGAVLAVRLEETDPEATRDSEEPVDRAKAFAEMRERQRLRTRGAPQKEWAKTSDPKGFSDVAQKPEGQDGYTPPTAAQTDAANELFERALLSKDVPDKFGDGVEDYLASDAEGQWAETEKQTERGTSRPN